MTQRLNLSDEVDFTATSVTDDHEKIIRAEYARTTIPPSTAIIETAAIAANTEPEALESLYGRIDMDAIDVLFKRHSGDSSESPLSVSSAYEGYIITIEKNGTGAVEPTEKR